MSIHLPFGEALRQLNQPGSSMVSPGSRRGKRIEAGKHDEFSWGWPGRSLCDTTIKITANFFFLRYPRIASSWRQDGQGKRPFNLASSEPRATIILFSSQLHVRPTLICRLTVLFMLVELYTHNGRGLPNSRLYLRLGHVLGGVTDHKSFALSKPAGIGTFKRRHMSACNDSYDDDGDNDYDDDDHNKI